MLDSSLKNNYKDFIEINFINQEDDARFLESATSAQDFLSRLSLIAGYEISPGTLIFLDEVQHIGHKAVKLSKFIIENSSFDLVLSGSFLGAQLSSIDSFPVGYAMVKKMLPLDFEEFCWANDVPLEMINQIYTHYSNKTPLEESLHDKFVQIFRRYIVVGGMPEAVQSYIDGNLSLGAARNVCAEILPQYRFDISKYASNRKLNVLSIFKNIPSELSKENKRFMMKSIKKGNTFERIKDDFEWLIASSVALPAFFVSEPKFPLERTAVKEKFKLYSLDCGLLLAQYPVEFCMKILEGSKSVNYGAVYENVIAQLLNAAGYELYYYHNSKKGEVDFLIETPSASILPIEVKSGKDYKIHMALNNLLSIEDNGAEYAYVLSEYNVRKVQKGGKTVYYLPLYMSMCFGTEHAQSLFPQKMKAIEFCYVVHFVK